MGRNRDLYVYWARGGLALIAAVVLFLASAAAPGSHAVATVTCPASGAANDGCGVMTVTPSLVLPNATGLNFTFTFNSGNNTFPGNSQFSLAVPLGWTQPTMSSGAGQIAVTAPPANSGLTPCTQPGTGATLSISSGPPWVMSGSVKCQSPHSGFSLTYSNVIAPGVGQYTFTTKTKSGQNGTLTPINASPVVTVTNAQYAAPVITSLPTGSYSNAGTSTNPLVVSGDGVSGNTVNLYSFSTSTCSGSGTQLGSSTTVDSTGSWSVPVTTLQDGQTYYLAASVTDGQTTYQSSCVAVAIDRTPPSSPTTVLDGTSTVETHYTNSTNTLSATWTGSSSTDVAGYQVAIGTTAGGNDVLDYTGVGNVTSVTESGLSLTDGTTYYVSVRAYDFAGNVSPSTTSSGITVDATPPTLSASHTANGSHGWNTSAPVTLTVTAGDTLSGLAGTPSCTVGSSALTLTPGGTSGTWTVGISGDGTHGISCSVSDNAGNQNTATDSITIDTQQPALSATHTVPEGTNGYNTSSPVIETITASDATSGLDGTPSCTDGSASLTLTAGTTTGTWTASVSGNGSHSINCSVSDLAGNSATATDTVHIDVPPSAPTFAAGIYTGGGTPATPFSMTGTASAGTTISVYESSTCGGSALATTTTGSDGTWSITLPNNTTGTISEGQHTYTARATDSSGFSSACSSAKTVIVDQHTPTSSVTFPGLGEHASASAWSGGCSTLQIVGLCGTASDSGSSGLAEVFVEVLGTSGANDGKYWQGTNTGTSSDWGSTGVWVAANLTSINGTTYWTVPMNRPADGNYMVAPAAVDNAGNAQQILIDSVCGQSASSATSTICTSGSGGFGSLISGNAALYGGNGALYSGNASLYGGFGSLYGGNASLYGGFGSLYGGFGSMVSGNASLYGGNASLYSGYGSLYSGFGSLYGGNGSLYGGYGSLYGGTGSLTAGNGGTGEQWSFLVDTAAPSLSSLTVDNQTADNSVNIDPTASIRLTFSEPMDLTSLTNHISLSPAPSAGITVSCGQDPTCENVSVSGLEGATYYTLTVGGGTAPCACVTDLAGNAKAATTTFHFTTAATSALTSTLVNGLQGNLDDDGDGIPNGWDGASFTANGHTIDTGSWGFSPTATTTDQKDLCLVENYMSGQAGDGNTYNQAISQTANAAIVAAFARSHIHLVIFEGDAAHSAGLPSTYTGPWYGGAIPMVDPLGDTSSGAFDWNSTTLDTPHTALQMSFDQIRNTNFIPTGLAQICHYAVIAHSLGNTTSSGSSRGVNASDLVTALAIANGGVGNDIQQEGTVMHELGHNLGLLHGGGDGTNFKPNYLSVMNYMFQFAGLVRSDGTTGYLDYSNAQLPDLIKNQLNESAAGLSGISPGLGSGALGSGGTTVLGTKVKCYDPTAGWYSQPVPEAATGPIDWNCDGDINTSSLVSSDINRDGHTDDTLAGFNDWAHLDFKAGTIGLGASGESLPPLPSTSTIDTDPNESGGVDSFAALAANSQSISFAPLLDKTFGDAPFTVSATGGASGNPVTFMARGNCTASGTNGATITITGAGSCKVTARQVGNDSYDGAIPVSRTFSIAKANQAITVNPAIPASAVYNTSFTVSASAPGGAITYGSSGVCTNSGATYTMTSGTGSCTVTVDQTGSSNYNAATEVTATVTAQKASQTINVGTAAPSQATYNSQFQVAATAPAGAVAFSSSGVCTNNGATYTITSGTGTCTVKFDQPGNDNYNPATEVTESVTAQRANQSITVNSAAPPSAAYKSSFTVSASAPGGTVTYGVSGSGVCTNTGATYTMTAGSGTCTVTYDQGGNSNYNAAQQVTNAVTATPAGQTITFGALANKTYGDPPFTVSATGGASGNPVTFSATGNCTSSGTNGATIAITGSGSCTVTANQAGNSNYSAAKPVPQTFSIGLGALYVLDPTAGQALYGSGQGCLLSSGNIYVNSSAGNAIYQGGQGCAIKNSPYNGHAFNATGGAAISVVGGFNSVCCTPAPLTKNSSGFTGVADPFAGVAMPVYSGGWYAPGGTTALPNQTVPAKGGTLQPGVYIGGISLSGGTYTMNPGVYVMDGGGFNLSSTASLSGSGVFIYNSNHTSPGSCGAIAVSSSGTVSLKSGVSGPDSQIVLAQDRACGTGGALTGRSGVTLTGGVYFPAAALTMTGQSSTMPTWQTAVVARTVTVGGQGTISLAHL